MAPASAYNSRSQPPITDAACNWGRVQSSSRRQPPPANAIPAHRVCSSTRLSGSSAQPTAVSPQAASPSPSRSMPRAVSSPHRQPLSSSRGTGRLLRTSSAASVRGGTRLSVYTCTPRRRTDASPSREFSPNALPGSMQLPCISMAPAPIHASRHTTLSPMYAPFPTTQSVSSTPLPMVTCLPRIQPRIRLFPPIFSPAPVQQGGSSRLSGCPSGVMQPCDVRIPAVLSPLRSTARWARRYSRTLPIRCHVPASGYSCACSCRTRIYKS